jgi:hypothetical protein
MMNNLELEEPGFTTSIRGYDRLQVDDYIARLGSLVADAEDRARAAESELGFSRHTTVGPRVAQIIDLAIEEAKELGERATAEADRLRADARREADETLVLTRQVAEEVKRDSDREREEALAEMAAAKAEADRELALLEASKRTLIGELRQLQEALAAATALVTVDGDADAGADGDAGADADPTIERPAEEISPNDEGREGHANAA